MRFFVWSASLCLTLTVLGAAYCRADIGPEGDNPPSLASMGTETSHARRDNWRWTNFGVAVLWAGTAADVVTSWKHPESSSWLQQDSGTQAGIFATTGLERKLALTTALTVATYLAARKKPKLRKYIGYFNLAIGGSQIAVAARNAQRDSRLQ